MGLSERAIEPSHAAILSRVAVAETKIDDIRDDISTVNVRLSAMEGDLKGIRQVLDGARGGWRVLVVVGSVIGVVLTIVGWIAPAFVRKLIG